MSPPKRGGRRWVLVVLSAEMEQMGDFPEGPVRVSAASAIGWGMRGKSDALCGPIAHASASRTRKGFLVKGVDGGPRIIEKIGEPSDTKGSGYRRGAQTFLWVEHGSRG